MPIISVYQSPQPDSILLGVGPKFNIIEVLQKRIKFSRGQAVVGVIGQVINDRGNTNVAFKLADMNELEAKYGGYRSWFGASEYVGDLFSQIWGLKHDNVVVCIPNMELQDVANVTMLVEFTRGISGPPISIPAGTRIAPSAGGETIAMLEDLVWGDTETGPKNVRVRQVSSNVEADLANYDTLIDGVLPANITITTPGALAQVPVVTVDLPRYQTAIDAFDASLDGMLSNVIFCDQVATGYNDAITDFVTARTNAGLFSIAVVSPGNTTNAFARNTGGGSGGSGDTTTFSGTDRLQTCYVHPSIRRVFPFKNTIDNLVTMCPQALFAFQIAKYKPEENASKYNAIASNYGVVAPAIPSDGAPDRPTHWNSNIVQPIMDIDFETLLSYPSFHDAIVLDGQKLHVVRLRHAVYSTVTAALQPYFKALGSPGNLLRLKSAISIRLERWVNQERIQAYDIAYTMDAVNDHLLLTVNVQRFGSMDVITMTFAVTGESVEVS